MIETERLRLRPWRPDERDVFAALVNTPAMTAHIGGMADTAQVEMIFRRRLDDQARLGFSYWAAERRADGQLVGTCGLRRADDYAGTPVAGMIEAGWRIGEPYWGMGYAAEAARAALGWGWANLDTDEVGAWTTEPNVASWRVMERIGMSRRPDLAFRHPRHAADDPAGAMLVYKIERPASRYDEPLG